MGGALLKSFELEVYCVLKGEILEKIYTHEEVKEIIQGCNLILAEYLELLSKSMIDIKKGNPMFPKFLDFDYPLTGNEAYKNFVEIEACQEKSKLINEIITLPSGRVISIPASIDYGIKESQKK